jgi:hypothetical protein
MATLRPQLEAIANRHRAVLKVSHERLDNLTDAQLRWAPDDKTWSIALVVDHLIKVHTATSPVFMRALLPAPPAGDERTKEVPYSFTDKLFVQLVSPGARFKLPVPKIYVPVVHNGPPIALVHKFQEELEAFSIILDYADEKQLKGVKVLSPAGNAKPSIVAYLDATVQHNRYHWIQIETILRHPQFPKGG